MKLKRVGYVYWWFLPTVYALLTQCSFDPPAAPSWEAELNLPLINKVYTMAELVDENDVLRSDSLGNLTFYVDEAIDPFSAQDQLAIEGMAQSFSQELGTFKIDAPGVEALAIQLRDIYPEADNLSGSMVPVPSFQFGLSPRALPAFQNFQWVLISQGSMELSIRNDLPFPLGKPLILDLKDAGSDSLVASFVFPEYIASHETQKQTLDLAGKRIGGNLALAVRGESPGSATPVTIDANDSFVMGVDISSLEVSAAAANIAPQQISHEEEVGIEDSIVVAEAHIRQGQLTVNFSGDFPVDTQIRLVLPDFADAQGEIYSDSVFIYAGGSSQLNLDLSGYFFRPQGDDFGTQKVRFGWTLKTLQPPNVPVTLEATDAMSADFQLSKLYFAEISGKFQSKWISIPRQSFSIDIPENVDKIAFDDAELRLELLNTINFPGKTNISIIGQNESGESVSVSVQENINPGDGRGNAVSSLILLSGKNSTIVDLLNILPNEIEVSGAVNIGDNGWFGSIRETDQVSGKIVFSAPLAFQLPEQSYEGDPSKIDIDSDIREKIRDNLESGELIARISNHLPLGAALEMMFATTDSMLYSNPELRIGPIAFESGSVDPATGLVSQAKQNEITIALAKEQIAFFTNEVIYGGVQVFLPGTGGQKVKLVADDFLNLQAYAKFKVLVDDNSN